MTRWTQSAWLHNSVIAGIGLLSIALLLSRMQALGVGFLTFTAILLLARIPPARASNRIPGVRIWTRVLPALVFFLPLLDIGLPSYGESLWGIPSGIAVGIGLQATQWSTIPLLLSTEYLNLLPPISAEDRFIGAVRPVLYATGQEYLYQGVLQYELAPHLGIASVGVVALLFAWEHLAHSNAKEMFDARDTMLHLLLSIGLGLIFFFSQSLIGCVLGHLTYDSWCVVQTLRRRSA